MYKAFLRFLTYIILVTVFLTLPSNASERADISNLLNQLHEAAAGANWPVYFDLFSDDAVFIGTDVSERWDIPTFKSYATPTDGWNYHVRLRHVSLSADNTTAWFDEILDSESYGTSRGTGVLIRTEKGWKIAQYHLTFPIPNPLVRKFTKEIKNFEKQKETKQ